MKTITLGNHELIVGDEIIAETVNLATRASRCNFPVLLCGPSGTGKELIARYVHARSDRSSGPFVSVNCAAIPENLLEAELFGFERGAFTGAVAQRIGKFELASRGTLLLDELSEMQLSLQAKLLRALQENEIDRIGGRATIPIDTRIIATSNREPLELVRNGSFREDLFYRINVIRIDCPPLKGRTSAIATFIGEFTRDWASRNRQPQPPFSQAALRRLVEFQWPGNIRELKNAVERAIFNSDGKMVESRHLDGVLNTFEKSPQTSLSGSGSLAEMEKNLILQTLGEMGGNRTHAAERLGISVRTLRNKIRQYRGPQESGTPGTLGNTCHALEKYS